MGHHLMFIRDDDACECDISVLAEREGYTYRETTWNAACGQSVTETSADLVIAFAGQQHQKALHYLEQLSHSASNKAALAVLSREAGAIALDQIAGLVDDFVLWPTTRDEILARIHRVLPPPTGKSSKDAAVRRLSKEIGIAQLVGEDPAFLQMLEKIPLLAASHHPVLIVGETGTGKEFSARAIHHLSKRAKYPFIPVDCGAIPEHVFENEMFGHARGGYTDAHTDQKGLAEMADGGVLFLDEIDSLSPSAQSKLLRFLQERTFKPLGSSRFVTVDVRVIAATNRVLEDCVRKGLFRADLYYRLNVLRLPLPPLRQRPLDIPLLALHFLQGIVGKAEASRRLSRAAKSALATYCWPGNVRELQNVIQQAALMADGAPILPEHLPFAAPIDGKQGAEDFRAGRAQALETFERAYVEELLRSNHGNVTHAAREANRNRRSIGRLIKKYNINKNTE